MSESAEHNMREKKARSFFDYGNDAALKNNLDYAIDMYRNALKLDPGNLLYRQALRGVQRRAFGNEPSKVGRLAGARVQPIKAGIRLSKAKGKWVDVLEGCEDVFKHNPWDVGAAQDAAEAAEHLALKPLSRWLLEMVVHQVGKDAGFFKYMAHVYEINEDWGKATSCWEKVKEFEPNNEEARRKINSLSASATISRSGLGAAIDKHKDDAGTSGPDRSAAEAEMEDMKRKIQTPEERLVKEIEADPSRVGLYLQLADIHKAHNRLDDAEKVLAQGRKAIPEDPVLKSAHGDIQIARLRRALDSWTKKLRDNPDDPAASEKIAAIQTKLSAYEMAEARWRAEAHPEDANLQIQYGRMLASIGKHDDAIAAFQKARSNPELKAQALHLAGESFEAKGLAKLAEKNFVEALALADSGDMAFQNQVRYRLGRVCEAQGKLKEAEDYYNEVAAEDYTYKDVAQRLQDLNSRGGS